MSESCQVCKFVFEFEANNWIKHGKLFIDNTITSRLTKLLASVFSAYAHGLTSGGLTHETLNECVESLDLIVDTSKSRRFDVTITVKNAEVLESKAEISFVDCDTKEEKKFSVGALLPLSPGVRFHSFKIEPPVHGKKDELSEFFSDSFVKILHATKAFYHETLINKLNQKPETAVKAPRSFKEIVQLASDAGVDKDLVHCAEVVANFNSETREMFHILHAISYAKQYAEDGGIVAVSNYPTPHM